MKCIYTIFFSLLFTLQSNAQIDGELLFKQKCRACHSIDKTLVGPALKGVEERRDSTWIFDFINGSSSMIENGDPIAIELFQQYNQIIMPDQQLEHEEIKSILSYISTESVESSTKVASIVRPTPYWESNTSRPMQFTDFMFWVPFTMSVIFLILILNYCVVIEDIKNDNRP